MTSDGGVACATCRFWDCHNPAGDDGICRRHAPAPRLFRGDPDDYLRLPLWPVTMKDEWCGEHEPRPGGG